MHDFLTTLRQRFRGDIMTDEASRKAYSRDTSLFSIMPAAVVAPRDAADLGVLIRAAAKHPGITLTARAAGTGMDGGALTESVVVDFAKYFTRIVGFSNKTGTTEPGVYYRDFERESLKRGLLMPSYPASRELCAVGGMVANNAGGELTLAYGKTSRYVRSLKAVLADGVEYEFKKLKKEELEKKILQRDFEGALYRDVFALIRDNYDYIQEARPKVSKNSSGYALWDVYDRERGTFDLSKVFVGAQGTLGFVTEVTFDLVPPDEHSQMMILFLDSFDRLGELVNVVLAHVPTTFESYDDKTLRLALRFFGEFMKRLGIRNVLSLVMHGIPEGLSIVLHGMPKLVLQITFDGKDPEILKRKANALAKALKEFSPRYMEVLGSTNESKQYWLIRRESFNLLRHKVRHLKTAPFIDDIVVPPETLPEFLPKLYEILNEYRNDMIHNIAGHIGNGNFHIIPLMDLSKKRSKDVIKELSPRVYDLVLSCGGSITGEHGDGIIRTPFVRQQFGDEVYRLFEKTKQIFDPQGIFNPGKKVGGTFDYALEHIQA